MIGPLISRELTLALRRGGFHILLVFQSSFAVVLVLAIERVVRQLTPTTPPALGTAATAGVGGPATVFASSVEAMLLLTWGGWLVLACSVAIPALAGASIARERERGTLSVILGAGTRPAMLVAAKLISAILLTITLIVSGVPALGLVLIFGNPRLESVVAAGLILFAWGCLTASLALVCSTLAKNAASGVASALIASGLLFFLVALLPVAVSALGVTLPGLAYRLDPLFALLVTEPEVGRRLVEQLANGPWIAAFVGEPALLGPAWLPFVVVALTLAAILGGATSLLVSRNPSDG